MDPFAGGGSIPIFFESNGGQAKAEATLPEIRLAVAEPDLDVGNAETALEALSTNCYYLSAEKNRYRFSLSPNLNKLLADRGASVQSPRVEERIRAEVQKVFAEEKRIIDRIYFPDKSGQIADAARLTLVVLPPDHTAADKATRSFVDGATKEHGSSARTFKSGLVWAVPEGVDSLRMTRGRCSLGKILPMKKRNSGSMTGKSGSLYAAVKFRIIRLSSCIGHWRLSLRASVNMRAPLR